jgi:hypothetical protein
MKMRFTLLVIVGLVMVGFTALLAQGVTPTTHVWTDFGGSACTINGVLMPIGTAVDAYSLRGAHVGHQVATAAGLYPFMAVYGKDGTVGSENYCVANEHDTIIFKLSDQVAYKLGPDSDIWEAGPTTPRIMNLAASDITEFSVAVTAPAGNRGPADTTIAYDVTVKNNGNGVDMIKFTLASKLGWTFTGWDSTGSYFNAEETKHYTVTVKIPPLLLTGVEDTLTVTATSRFKPTVLDFKKIVTVVDNETGVDETNYTVPGRFSLNQNFPNPFNPETVISFNLQQSTNVTLAVYDILGRKVTTLADGYLAAGEYQYRWSGADDNNTQVSSGVYFYRLTAGETNLTRKMALLK